MTREDEHPIHIVLAEKGILISHTNVVWKCLDHPEETYEAYGLTGVLTYPPFRRQGYVSRVIKAGMDYVLKSDAGIAMFYCDQKLINFYARHGWIHIDKSVSYTGEKKKRAARVEDEILTMLFISPKDKRDRVAFEHKPIYFVSDYTW